jgi:hypothetical protein
MQRKRSNIRTPPTKSFGIHRSLKLSIKNKIQNKGKNREKLVRRITIDHNQTIPIIPIPKHPICGKSVDVCVFCSFVIALNTKKFDFKNLSVF